MLPVILDGYSPHFARHRIYPYNTVERIYAVSVVCNYATSSSRAHGVHPGHRSGVVHTLSLEP